MADDAIGDTREPVERYSEFAPITFKSDPVLAQPGDNPNVKVELEKQDVSIGKARYNNTIPISPNLAVETRTGGQMRVTPHANVRVTFLDSQGHKVRMTERYVKGWTITPLRPDATVDDLSQWRIQGLNHSEYIPFSPMRTSRKEQVPLDFWEHASREDAPGFNCPVGDVFGTLQEFVVGNEKVGGAYYQVYTLSDKNWTRVFSTNPLTFSLEEYRKLVRALKDPAQKRKYLDKLYFMPQVANDEKTGNPKRIPKLTKPATP